MGWTTTEAELSQYWILYRQSEWKLRQWQRRGRKQSRYAGFSDWDGTNRHDLVALDTEMLWPGTVLACGEGVHPADNGIEKGWWDESHGVGP